MKLIYVVTGLALALSIANHGAGQTAKGLYDPSQKKKPNVAVNPWFAVDSGTTESSVTLYLYQCPFGYLDKKDGLCHLNISFTEDIEDLKCTIKDREVVCTWKPKEQK